MSSMNCECSDKEPIHILLVDDDEDDYILTRDLLAEASGTRFELKWVSTFEAGLEAIDQEQHEVYLFDYRLGNGSGLELLRMATMRGIKAPIIILTAQGGPEVDMAAMEIGAHDFLDKRSLTPQLLERSIRYALERKRAEETLRESEEKFRSLSENAPDIIYTLGVDGSITYVNPQWEKILGYEKDETLGKHFGDFIGEKGIGDHICLFEGVKNDKQVIRNETITLYAKDGSPRFFDLSGGPDHTPAGEVTGMVGLLKDITEQRKIEAQLRQAQKMEAIGTLTGGIAHDFNNILGAIIGHAEIGKMKLPEESEAIVNIDQVLKAGNRAAKLVKQIVTISRQHHQEQRPVQIRYVVREALKLLKATLPTTIEIKENLFKDTGIVHADPTQMHQVIMNLGTNAGHAMQEDGGVLEVSLANVEFDDIEASKYLDIHAAGSYLRLTVSDTGQGMSPEIMEQIFDPYFTTKGVGEGTGLGLSVAHGIVSAHGGTITVYSEPGKGTTFHVYLPVILEAGEKEKESEGPLPTGTERILFVDDEEALANIGKQMLEQLGYEVSTFTNSMEALDRFSEDAEKFDLVITDLTMPKITGDRLAQEAIKIRPRIPVIVCSGFLDKLTREKAKERGAKVFIQKPLTAEKLARTVREVLDEKVKDED